MGQVKFDFTGKRFVITGASSGMGRQVSLELAEAGANILAIARGRKALDELQKIYPANIEITEVDVCDSERLEEAIQSFVKVNGKLDGAVHAAGISKLTPLRAYNEEEARLVMDISFWAGVKLLQICTKVRNSASGASFLLFSSVRAVHTDKGLFSYAGAKTAVKIAAQTFAKEIAQRGLRINTISPGWIKTQMTEGLEETHNLDEVYRNSLLGIGEASDVSGMVLFLLSNRAKWITGADFVVDGGYLA